MTEQQRYRVLRTIGGGRAELRRYAPCVMADVIVSGDYRRATYQGFRPLLTYISRHQVAMTAPVLQEEATEASWRVSFVMPAGSTTSTLPVPDDREVRLREVPEHDAAAIRFPGFAAERTVARQEARLRAALTAEGLTPLGTARVARFDPPWTPAFLRHNEVVIDVQTV